VSDSGEQRLGVVAVFIENRLEAAPKVNQVLSDFAPIVVGRMGIPYRERNMSVVAIIVDGTNDDIGGLTGRLGAIPGVSVKSALKKKEADVIHCPNPSVIHCGDGDSGQEAGSN
jgi:putative iron-only hydrogenase system regulator